jgi:tRNA-uridine 2-sulfurtransferase
MSNSTEKVICAMSGGVDSSVAAKLLVDAGYEVMGITMKLFDNDGVILEEGSRTCCSLEDVEDARNVAYALGIPYHVFNYTDSFGSCVVDKFCSSYLGGRTPNPCIDCNRYLKFGALQQRRAELGYDYVATGHYARREFDHDTGRFLLKKGLDPKKDQSYVLYHLTQEQLAHMLFPVGELSKPKVREVAAEAGLENANKLESQDICFVPDGDYASFISGHTGKDFEPGNIVDEQGNVLGRHSGLVHYTIGQRKGLGVAAGEPLFVLKKDVPANTLVVGPASSAGFTTVYAEDVNLISVASIEEPIQVEVKANYRAKAKPATASMENGVLKVVLQEPERAIAPGQALVMYQSDVVVGGGTIERAE